MTSPASNGRHATGKPPKATWLSKPTPNTCLFAGLRQPAEHRSSSVMGPLQLAPTRVPVRAQSCSSLPKLHRLLSPLPWRQCSSLMRPFGARLQSRCPTRTLCCAGLLSTSYFLYKIPWSASVMIPRVQMGWLPTPLQAAHVRACRHSSYSLHRLSLYFALHYRPCGFVLYQDHLMLVCGLKILPTSCSPILSGSIWPVWLSLPHRGSWSKSPPDCHLCHFLIVSDYSSPLRPRTSFCLCARNNDAALQSPSRPQERPRCSSASVPCSATLYPRYACALWTRLLFPTYIKGLKQAIERDYTNSFLTPSSMPHMRADCLHVYFSLQLLHGSVLRHHNRWPPDCHLCRLDHIRLRLRRIFNGYNMGQIER